MDPNVPHKVTGDTLSADECNSIVDSIVSKLDADDVPVVLTTPLTGIDFSNSGNVVAADTVLTGFGKLQSQNTNAFKIPAGGTTGQVLGKASNTSGDTSWQTPTTAASSIRVYNVESYGAVHNGTTDDTAAIQACINAVDAAGGGTVYFPLGIYLIAGALNGTTNAQISIPPHPYANSVAHNHIRLLGEVAPNFYSDPIYLSPKPLTGVILKSTLVGTGNIIGNYATTGQWGIFNYCHLEIENIHIEIKSKTGGDGTDFAPQPVAINAFTLAYLTVNNVVIDTSSEQPQSILPKYTCKGIVCPNTNNFVFVSITNTLITSVYTAVECYEHANLNNVFIDACYEGLRLNSSNHAMHVDKICIARCARSVVINGTLNFTIDQLVIEDVITGWWAVQCHLDERVLGVEGHIRFNRVVSGTGLDNSTFIRSNYAPSNITVESLGGSTRLLKIKKQTGSYTLVKTDFDSVIKINSGSASNLTVPTMSSVYLPIGTKLFVTQDGAGAVNILGAAGVTILSVGTNYTSNGQGSEVSLQKVAWDTWQIAGNLTSTGSGGSGTSNGWDSDIENFITQAGVINTTEQTAVKNLVLALKAASIWTKVYAIYPLVGSNQKTASTNLKDPTKYRLTYGGNPTFGNLGFITDGVVTYASTNFYPNTELASQNSMHAAYYSPVDINSAGVMMGAVKSPNGSLQLQVRYNGGGNNYSSINADIAGTQHTNPSSTKGLFVLNRNNSANEDFDFNGSSDNKSFPSLGLPSYPIALGGQAIGPGPTAALYFVPNGCGFASLGEGFTTGEKSSFNTTVQTFLTALSR